MTSKTRYARSAEVSIAYQVVGDGPIDIVWVPGIYSHLEFQLTDPGFAIFVKSLAAFSRLILFDKRGTGMSDRDVGVPSLEERMDDVRAVMDAAGSERPPSTVLPRVAPWRRYSRPPILNEQSALVLFGTFPRATAAPGWPGISAEDWSVLLTTQPPTFLMPWTSRPTHRASPVTRRSGSGGRR